MNRTVLIILVLVLVAALAWAFMNQGGSGGLANPASVFCAQQGGTVDIRTDASGSQFGADGAQFGVCVFPDGSECEEWAYFYNGGSCDTSMGSQLANPASAFCAEQGGTVEIRTASDGSQFGVCVFPDGSECEEWAFFRNNGSCNAP